VGSDAVEAVLYRDVDAVGTYLDEDTVVVENRSYNGASGGWVLTPLELREGLAVVVNRGFIGFTHAGTIEAPPAPSGEVRVEGLVFPSQQRGSFGAIDPDEGELEVLARVDLDRFDAQVDDDLLPAYIQLVSSDPVEPERSPEEPQLVALGPPDVGEGPHLSYAVQWFTFTTIAVVGYVLVLRRAARDEARPPPEVPAGAM
jgi:cytochrome oxidase assembly protein ShyY1